jgi:predicted DsbA family dithiol-disulfide isomerase
MMEGLRRAGSQYGIEFGGHTLLSNSRLALEASEFAKDHNKFDPFHEKLFHACFTELKDIGEKDLILDLAEQIGLNKSELADALDSGKYKAALEQAQHQGHAYGVTGTPTFIVNDQYKIVGAQPLEAIKDFLRKIEAEAK